MRRASRASRGNSLAHIDGKLPFKYVHLLSFMAKFNMVLMAVTRGAAIGMHCHLDRSPSHQFLNILLEVTRLLFIPVLYQACFDLYAALHNPWGVDEHDFPELSLEQGSLEENVAIMQHAALSFDDRSVVDAACCSSVAICRRKQ